MSDKQEMVSLDLLRRSFAMRATSYTHFYNVMTEQFGREKAIELSCEATHRLGVEISQKIDKLDPNDVDGFMQAYAGIIPAGQAMFEHEIYNDGGPHDVIKFHTCPLKQAWEDAGASDALLHDLCVIAGAFDRGLVEGAGFTYEGEVWEPGRTGCCLLRVAAGPAPTAQA